MLNFGQKVEEKSGELIPKDALLWAVINIREVKNSRETNGRYLDIELTICDGIPYARRKVWVMIADPFDANNSEEWRTMGYGAIRRILEAVKGATPDNTNSYTLNQLQDLHGLTVPIIVSVEVAKKDSGYDDKNKAEFLSPYSSVKKICEAYRLLQTGVYQYGKPAAPAGAPTPGSMFAGTASPPPVGAPMPPATAPQAAGAPAPNWLAPAGTPPAPAAPAQVAPQAFTVGQAPAPHQVVPVSAVTHQPPVSTPPLVNPAAPIATTSPSDTWQPQPAAAPAQFPPGSF